MSTQQAHTLDRLLQKWNKHQDLRIKGATPAELWKSRTGLDEVRLEMQVAA